jgi:FHA domain-containing protein/zinc ribbon family protein
MTVLSKEGAQGAELHAGAAPDETLAGPGSLTCVECGYALSLAALDSLDSLPHCPTCGGSRFRRASIFDQPTVDTEAVSPADTAPAWIEGLRERCAGQGPHIVYHDGSEPIAFTLDEGWMRIGRSGSADIQLDDPTVSRRHALVVRTADGDLRALDDRSLNGLFVNGERVDWAPLGDGDELEIGRYRLYVLDG